MTLKVESDDASILIADGPLIGLEHLDFGQVVVVGRDDVVGFDFEPASRVSSVVSAPTLAIFQDQSESCCCSIGVLEIEGRMFVEFLLGQPVEIDLDFVGPSKLAGAGNSPNLRSVGLLLMKA